MTISHHLRAACLAAALAFAASSPAAATETTINWQGTVVATPDPTQAFGLKVGDPVNFSVTFDPSMLIDRSQTFYNIDAISGQHVPIPGLRTASLFDDPASAFSMTIAGHSFTKTDQLHYGLDKLGVGAIPLAVFQNSTFVGVVFAGQAADGLFVDVDPIALALHYFPTDGIGFDQNSSNPGAGFLLSGNLPPLVTGAVPEADSWALMLAALGLAGAALRAQRRHAARPLACGAG